jgi:hypothetical protein
MNDSSPEQKPRDQALRDIEREKADSQANQDVVDWRDLGKTAAFERTFMRRVKEEIAKIEEAILTGVIPENYHVLVAVRAKLVWVTRLPALDKAAAWKHLHPTTPIPEDY